ncbi:MAG: NADH-quinone oxidoreductase subunit K [Patescibacteria group bacterium]
MDYTFLQFLMIAAIFLSAVLLHITRRNSTAVLLYFIQSLAIVVLLFHPLVENFSPVIMLMAILTLAIKAVVAPLFFSRLIKRHKLKFSASTYLNTPLTLIAITVLTALTNSRIFSHITSIEPSGQKILSLAIAVILISFFLIINRKGAVSQIIGILSLENGIVAFALFSGLEQSPALQIGIMFDLLVWVIIAAVFISMIYKQFGSLDVTELKHLKE